ncbi:MAG: sugar transferase [Oscillospiraceae bacterium]|nr:sugar transferase [Oscillospiraceae bacterium]
MLDILAATLLLAVGWPLLGAVALLILAQRDGKVLFRQERPGKEGKIFLCCKFRTMRAEKYPGETDMQRMTGVGRFLRRFSLDELPQLWNILRGEMSFIGPRPLLPEYIAYYTQQQCRRHETRPGLTGWAQVHGRNALDWETRLALDCWYVEHQSFRLDVQICLRTIGKLFSGDGVNAGKTQTAERFTDYVLRNDAIRHGEAAPALLAAAQGNQVL